MSGVGSCSFPLDTGVFSSRTVSSFLPNQRQWKKSKLNFNHFSSTGLDVGGSGTRRGRAYRLVSDRQIALREHYLASLAFLPRKLPTHLQTSV